jgi:hypothetical protein
MTGATSGAGIAYPSGAPEWLCICVLGALILTLFLRFYAVFWNCSDSGICFCVFHFIVLGYIEISFGYAGVKYRYMFIVI